MAEIESIKIGLGEDVKELLKELKKNTRWKKIDATLSFICGLCCLALGIILLIKG